MVDLTTELSGIRLSNPVIPASGTFGFGKEYWDLYDLDILGSISFKGTTVEERYGNELPRIAECYQGMINSVGLQNPGMEEVIKHEIPELAKHFHKPLIANISGFSVPEYVKLAEAMSEVPEVGILEVNVSCPNVHGGGMAFGTSSDNVAEVTREVKKAAKKPVYIKLSPNVTDIVSIAKAAEDAGADGLALINTLLGMRIDIKRRQPVIHNKMGGFSGPAIFPVAVRMVYQVSKAINIPVIGMGGVSNAKDVVEMMMAGASAVEVGAANLVDPFACRKILEELPEILEELKIEKLSDIIGCVE